MDPQNENKIPRYKDHRNSSIFRATAQDFEGEGSCSNLSEESQNYEANHPKRFLFYPQSNKNNSLRPESIFSG